MNFQSHKNKANLKTWLYAVAFENDTPCFMLILILLASLIENANLANDWHG